MNDYGKIAAYLSSEFSLYLMEHEDMARRLPSDALIIFDIAGEYKFNKWHHDMSIKNKEPEQLVARVCVGKMRRHAAIDQVEMALCSE